MKKLVVSLFALAMLAGCGSKEPQTVVCTKASEGTEVTLNAEGDTVNTQVYKESVFITTLGLTEADFGEGADREAKLAELKTELYSQVEGIEGITVTLELTDGKLIATETYDFNVVDMDKLEELDLVEGGLLSSDSISLEKTVDGYKEAGMVCN